MSKAATNTMTSPSRAHTDRKRRVPRRKVCIALHGQECVLTPHLPELAERFTYRHHRTNIAKDGVAQLEMRCRPLLPTAEDRVLPDPLDSDVYPPHLQHPVHNAIMPFPSMVTGGLALPVAVLAAARGYAPSFRMQTSAVVQKHRLAGELGCHVCDFVESHAHGLIRHDLSVSGIARLIVRIAAAFPQAKLAFVSTRFELLQRIYDLLPAELQRETTLADAADVPDQPRRLLLGTAFALAPCTNWDDRRQITVLLDAAEITHERMQMALLWQHTRLFGLSRLGTKLPPKTRDLMFAAFGPQETTLPSLGRRCRRVETVLCRPIGTFSRTPYEPWQLSRSQIQQLGLRNEMLSIVAHGVAKGNNIDDRLERPLSAAWQRPLQTLVLTDSVEHAEAIGRNMATWPIIVGDDAYLDGLPDPNRYQTVDRFLAGDAKNLIATTAAAARLDWERFDAVVWAGGGCDGPLPPFAKLTCPAGLDQRLLLVDVHDRHHAELRQQTAKRRRNYDACDWFPLGADDVACRCRRYWRERGVKL